MSSDRRPAKVRVVSSGAIRSADGAASAPTPTPGRRRTDALQGEIATAAASKAAAEGASLMWVVGALGLFLIGCVIGGALFVVTGIASAPPL